MGKSGTHAKVRKAASAKLAKTTTNAKARRTRPAKGGARTPQDPGPSDTPVSPKLTQMVYGKLLRAIVQGRLDLGEPLSENDLARALNLSKAPIRESLNELRVRGLVEVVPRSGSYVFSPTPEQIAELCDYRALLETNALRISMKRDPKALVTTLRRTVTRMRDAHLQEDVFAGNELDKDYHMSMIRLSHNRYLTESYEHISLTVEALRYRVMSTSLYRSRVQQEHARIAELLAANQLARATRVLESHIRRVKHVQSKAEWSTGRLKRKDYRFRDYASILL